MIPIFILACTSNSQKIKYVKHTIPTGFNYEDNGFGGIIASDLDLDKRFEIIITQQNKLGVYSTSGKEWWLQDIDINVNSGYGFLPGTHGAGVQVARIGSDKKIVLLALSRRNTLIVIDAIKGSIIKEAHLPSIYPSATRWEHLLVCNFRGRGDADLLLQATESTQKPDFRVGRFLAAFSISDLINNEAPKPIWFRDDYIGPAHGGARVADIDLDGKDEVIGATLIDHKGELIITVPVGEEPNDHVDAIHIDDVRPDLEGLEVLLLQENHGRKKKLGNNIFLFNKTGIIFKTNYNHIEPQNAAIGEFDLSLPGREIWLRSRYNEDQTPFVIDSAGRIISSYRLNEKSPVFWSKRGIEVIVPIYWHNHQRQLIAAKERHTSGHIALIDPMTGTFLADIPDKAIRLYSADIMGDWREELITINQSTINIYSNISNDKEKADSPLWEDINYRRSKQFWTYYYP